MVYANKPFETRLRQVRNRKKFKIHFLLKRILKIIQWPNWVQKNLKTIYSSLRGLGALLGY